MKYCTSHVIYWILCWKRETERPRGYRMVGPTLVVGPRDLMAAWKLRMPPSITREDLTRIISPEKIQIRISFCRIHNQFHTIVKLNICKSRTSCTARWGWTSLSSCGLHWLCGEGGLMPGGGGESPHSLLVFSDTTPEGVLGTLSSYGEGRSLGSPLSLCCCGWEWDQFFLWCLAGIEHALFKSIRSRWVAFSWPFG